MIKRRNLLLTGSVGGGVLATTAYLSWLPDLRGFDLGSLSPYFLQGGQGAQLLAVAEGLDSADVVGEIWLDTLETRPTLPELMRLLAARLPAGEQDLSVAIASGVSRDFANGALCEVQGWRLSLTECQLAGLRRVALEAGLFEAAAQEPPIPRPYTIGEIAPVENWGPQRTTMGQPFNRQLDGHSGMWFQIKGAPARARIMIDGVIAPTSVSEKSVSSGLHGTEQDRILGNPGRYEVALVDPIRRIKQPVGYFEVGESTAQLQGPLGFCAVKKWGPQQTRAGVAVNEQPDGSMGLWFHTDCLPPDVQLLFGDDPLVYHRKDFGLTARLPLALVGAPGRVPLSLRNILTGEKQVFGHLVIE